MELEEEKHEVVHEEEKQVEMEHEEEKQGEHKHPRPPRSGEEEEKKGENPLTISAESKSVFQFDLC